MTFLWGMATVERRERNFGLDWANLGEAHVGAEGLQLAVDVQDAGVRRLEEADHFGQHDGRAVVDKLLQVLQQLAQRLHHGRRVCHTVHHNFWLKKLYWVLPSFDGVHQNRCRVSTPNDICFEIRLTPEKTEKNIPNEK